MEFSSCEWEVSWGSLAVRSPKRNSPRGDRSEWLAKHTQRAMQENARQGYWNGSVPPFGYRALTTDTVGNRGRHKRRLEIDPVEAETAREIYRLYLAGPNGQVIAMKAIVSHLNRQGLSMRGRPWRIEKVNRLLADPLYTGCFYLKFRHTPPSADRNLPGWGLMTKARNATI
jgi:hypothetical protein